MRTGAFRRARRAAARSPPPRWRRRTPPGASGRDGARRRARSASRARYTSARSPGNALDRDGGGVGRAPGFTPRSGPAAACQNRKQRFPEIRTLPLPMTPARNRPWTAPETGSSTTSSRSTTSSSSPASWSRPSTRRRRWRGHTKVLTTIAATGAVLLILTSVLPAKGLQAFLREKRWTLWLGFLATFACAGFVSVAHGDQGLLASGSGRWPISRARSSTSMPRSRPSSKRRPRFVPTPRSFARSPKPRS